MRELTLMFVLLASVGCAPSESTLVVDLVTDLRAGIEWDGARIVVDGEPRGERLADGDADYVSGARLLDLPVSSGAHRLEIVLSNDGIETIRRPARVEVEGTTGVTIVISRQCRGVMCPADDAAFEACLAGACVEPSCTPETPAACPTAECAADADCEAPPAACAIARCVEGSCLAVDDGSCGNEAYCAIDVGCLEVPETPTATPGTREGLVVWLPMDDDPSDGVVVDATEHGFDALCARDISCPSSVPGRVGGALAFDATQLLRIPHDPALDTTAEFTLAVWVWLDGPGSMVPVARPYGPDALDTWAFVRWDTSGTCFEATTALGGEDTCGPRFGEESWTHLAALWDGSVKSLYINGVIVAMNASPEPIVFDTHT